MKQWYLTFCLVIASLFGGVGVGFASDLPPCSSLPFHNCFGTYTWADGEQYVGEFKDNKRNGQGTYTFANGNKYVGDWRDGKQHGKGIITYGIPSHGKSYVGDWRDGKPNGHGKITFSHAGHGDHYVGQVRNFSEHGHGTRYYPDGRIYSGSWNNTLKHGNGILFFEDIILVGNWKYNTKLKTHKVINSLLPDCPFFYDPAIYEKPITLSGDDLPLNHETRTDCMGFFRFEEGESYAGDWQRNQFHGQGAFIDPSGLLYVGSWNNGEKNGQGTLTLPDGGMYEGQFKDSDFDGVGTYTVYSNGEIESVLEGVWKNGEFQYALENQPPALAETSIGQEEVISASSGSGFAVSYDGHIITNNHVIEGCQKLIVHQKGNEVPVTVVTYDPQNDLALLKGDFKPKAVFPLSNERPELLQDVYVAGYPFGKEISTSVKVTKGIISSLTGIGNNFSNIQIDAALQPGNSGGPILDNNGNLVGVAVEKLNLDYILENYGVVPEGTNFGIKSNIVRNLLDSNEVDNPAANLSEISKTKLGKMISKGTYYISCWMTAAQIEKMQSEKVMFSNLK